MEYSRRMQQLLLICTEACDWGDILLASCSYKHVLYNIPKSPVDNTYATLTCVTFVLRVLSHAPGSGSGLFSLLRWGSVAALHRPPLLALPSPACRSCPKEGATVSHSCCLFLHSVSLWTLGKRVKAASPACSADRQLVFHEEAPNVCRIVSTTNRRKRY